MAQLRQHFQRHRVQLRKQRRRHRPHRPRRRKVRSPRRENRTACWPASRRKRIRDRKVEKRMSTLIAPVPLTDPELKLLQTLVYQECGMHFDERRTHFLPARPQRPVKACNVPPFYSYSQPLTSREGKKELSALLENLTVNETSFFRVRPQLDLFQKVILEEILKRKQEKKDWTLRIWSAGCSTGQEPYTLAILICDALAYYYLRNPLPFEMPTPKPLIPPPWKVEIVASDISYSALLTAQQGIYTEAQMETVDYTCRLRYFDKVG